MNKATIGTFLAALAISAYALTETEPVDAPLVNIPNPASVYCIKIGGKLRSEKSPQGERTFCVLPDGTEIEEWELYWRDHPQDEQK